MALGGNLYGYVGDVNNSIPMSNMYPGGRATAYVPPTASSIPFRNNSAGELGALNQRLDIPAQAAGMGGMDGGRPTMRGSDSIAPSSTNTAAGKPATWWVMFFVVFMLFVWLSRKYDTGQVSGNLKLSLFNGIFLTLFVVLILNLLKVFAAKVKVPGLSEMILAA